MLIEFVAELKALWETFVAAMLGAWTALLDGLGIDVE